MNRSHKFPISRLPDNLPLLHHHFASDNGINGHTFNFAAVVRGPAYPGIGSFVADRLLPLHVHNDEIRIRPRLNDTLTWIDTEDPCRIVGGNAHQT